MKLFSRLKHNKKILILPAVIISIFFIASLFSVTQVSGFEHEVANLSHWLRIHNDAWIVWHVIIGFAIFFVWGNRIEGEGKRLKKSPAEIEHAKLFRYCVIVGMLLIEGVLHLWR